MDFLHRLLDLVQQELEAEDARVEIGGRDPEDPRLIWATLPTGWRVVAVMPAPPEDGAAAREKLATLVGAFTDTAERVQSERPQPASDAVVHVLDDELAGLSRRAGAVHAAIIDRSSPVVWASSQLSRNEEEDVDLLVEAADADARAREAGVDLAHVLSLDLGPAETYLSDAGVEQSVADATLRTARNLRSLAPTRNEKQWRSHLLLARAVAATRRAPNDEHRVADQREGFGLLARTLADIYWVTLAFDGPFSELHAEAATVHAHHYLERLLAALPPRDPGPGGGKPRAAKVVRFPGT